MLSADGVYGLPSRSGRDLLARALQHVPQNFAEAHDLEPALKKLSMKGSTKDVQSVAAQSENKLI